jgi:hypothetical protein
MPGIRPPQFSEGNPSLRTSSGSDLLPSGLYRRPRSFTGSWGFDALMTHKGRRGIPSRALPPIGNWEVMQPFPHPAPKVDKLTSLRVALVVYSSQDRKRQRIVNLLQRSARQCLGGSSASGLARRRLDARSSAGILLACPAGTAALRCPRLGEHRPHSNSLLPMGDASYNSWMRKIQQGLTLALLVMGLGLTAQKAPSAEQVLAEAKAQAAAQGKNIFVLFGASW